MRPSDFPDRIFVADLMPADAGHTELTFTEDPETVAGLPARTYVPESEIDWNRLAHAETHPLRVSILEMLTIDGGRVLSPNEIAFELQVPLGNLNYHVKELLKAGFVELVDTEQRRGVVEHYYRLTVREDGDGG